MSTTYFDGKSIHIDPHDLSGMVKLMNRYKEFDFPWSGKNGYGELIEISVNKDNITVQTFQENGFVRENVYWRDGVCEELFTS